MAQTHVQQRKAGSGNGVHAALRIPKPTIPVEKMAIKNTDNPAQKASKTRQFTKHFNQI